MTVPGTICQDYCIRDSSVPKPRVWVLLVRTQEYFSQYGVWRGLRRVEAFVSRKVNSILDHHPMLAKANIRDEEVLDLHAGDLITVKSEEQIRRTLDSSNRTRGLGFMEGMVRHCGKTYRVYKPARIVVLEGTGEVRRLKNTVLLEGVICDGEHLVCDRSCFYFWRECWLTRVSSSSNSSFSQPSIEQ